MSLRGWLKRGLVRLEIVRSGYLNEIGWFDTRADGVARDKQGKPIPWFTYPAIKFLEERIQSNWKVLEFGAGMGTIWWSGRVGELTAVEHDAGWATRISGLCAAKLLSVDGGSADSYLRPTRDGGEYDVVIVDGLFRVECLIAAPELLSASGVVILDDAQREEYRPGIDALRARGFKTLAFHGPQPVSKHPGCTTFIYREANVLGL